MSQNTFQILTFLFTFYLLHIVRCDFLLVYIHSLLLFAPPRGQTSISFYRAKHEHDFCLCKKKIYILVKKQFSFSGRHTFEHWNILTSCVERSSLSVLETNYSIFCGVYFSSLNDCGLQNFFFFINHWFFQITSFFATLYCDGENIKPKR